MSVTDDSEQYTSIILLQGGAGDILAATPVIRGFRRKYPDDKLVILSTYAQLLEHNPNIDVCVSLNDPRDFYTEYVFDKKVRFFKKHFIYDHIMDGDFTKGCTSLPEFICNVYGIDYDGLSPDYFITEYERRMAKTFLSQTENKKVLLHTYGATPSDGGYQRMLCGYCGGRGISLDGARCQNCGGSGVLILRDKTNSLKDIDPTILAPLVKKYSDKGFDFLQIGLEGEPLVEGAVDCLGMPMRETCALIPYVDSFIFIESLFAHVAGACEKPGVVVFQNTSPLFFGYPTAHNFHGGKPCIDWPCNRPVGALLDFLPGYRNPKTKQKLLWECADQKCAQFKTEEIEEVFLKSLDGRPRKDAGFNSLESAQKSGEVASKAKRGKKPKKRKNG